MKQFVRNIPCLFPVFLLVSLLAGITEMKGQTVKMVIEVSSLFSLNPLSGGGEGPPANETAGNRGKPLQWLEITGDENVEILVHIAPGNDSITAWYINRGLFDVNDAVPFENNGTSFILNAAYGKFLHHQRFKAWIGLGDNPVCSLTVEYL